MKRDRGPDFAEFFAFSRLDASGVLCYRNRAAPNQTIRGGV